MNTQNEEQNFPGDAPADQASQSAPSDSGESASPLDERKKAKVTAKSTRRTTSKKAAAEMAQPNQSASKRTRTSRSATKQGEDQVTVDQPAKPRRRSVKEARETTTTASGTLPATDDIPPVTDEAIAFLGRENPTSEDVLKLSPSSLAFVQHHHKLTSSLDAMSDRNYEILTKARPASPAIQEFVDAIVKMRREEKASTLSALATTEESKSTVPLSENPVAVSYRPSPLSISSPVTIVVQLRNLAIGRTKALVSPDMVASALDDKSRSKFVEKANERVSQLDAENTIERGPVQLFLRPEQVNVKTVLPQAAGDTQALDGLVGESSREFGRRAMRVVSRMTQRAGAWFAESKNSAPVSAKIDPSLTTRAATAIATTSADLPIDKSFIIPESVASRFLKVEHEYFFNDKTPAFSDRGNKLATRGSNADVIKSLIEIAIARDWDTVTVKGTDDFRRKAWMEAAIQGVAVTGYTPTALDLADLATRPASNWVEKGMTKVKSPVLSAPAAPAERPTRKAQPDQKASVQGEKIPSPQLFEKSSNFNDEKPAYVVKKFPDLAPAYGIVEAAKRFAEDKLPEASCDEFVAIARKHVIQKIIAGEAIRGPKIYQKAAASIKVRKETETPERSH